MSKLRSGRAQCLVLRMGKKKQLRGFGGVGEAGCGALFMAVEGSACFGVLMEGAGSIGKRRFLGEVRALGVMVVHLSNQK